MSLEHGPAPKSEGVDVVALVVALAPVAIQLIQIAGPELAALIQAIHGAPEEPKSILRTALLDAHARIRGGKGGPDDVDVA